MVTDPLFQIKLHLLSTVVLSGFQSSPEAHSFIHSVSQSVIQSINQLINSFIHSSIRPFICPLHWMASKYVVLFKSTFGWYLRVIHNKSQGACADLKGTFHSIPASLVFLWPWPHHTRVTTISREISMPRDRKLELSDRSEIWQAYWQHRCRLACRIWDRSDSFNIQSHNFETSRDFMVRRVTLSEWRPRWKLIPLG